MRFFVGGVHTFGGGNQGGGCVGCLSTLILLFLLFACLGALL